MGAESDRSLCSRAIGEGGIKPSPRAVLHILIKRLYYDLIGLPPGPAEVDAFVSDESSDAYAALVKRLLASNTLGSDGAALAGQRPLRDSDGYEKTTRVPTPGTTGAGFSKR